MNSIITNPPSILTPTQQSNIATYGNPTGVKSYVALLTQTGTDAPVATVLENTLGGTVVWTYTDAGEYLATLVGVFTANKTAVNISSLLGLVTGVRNDADSVAVKTFRAADDDDTQINGLLTATFIEILVYP